MVDYGQNWHKIKGKKQKTRAFLFLALWIVFYMLWCVL